MLELADYTRLRDGTTLKVAIVDWPEPYQPVTVWHRFRSWKRGPTPEQLERALQQVLTTKKYFFVCGLCRETVNTGHRYEKDLCQGCASQHLGVVY